MTEYDLYKVVISPRKHRASHHLTHLAVKFEL